mmetsp:Transcript_2736/g.5872  ORF Transcript_2736/g.5872 Transcript_2736/m.5872 type:complete len:299 (+) Transcript_2736:859-1755(+)
MSQNTSVVHVADADKLICIRYMYDGGVLAHARICLLEPQNGDFVTGSELMDILEDDGVDFNAFYASVYETEVSGGGWLPIHSDITKASDISTSKDIELPISTADNQNQVAPRIDVKLYHRPADGMPERTYDSMIAYAKAQPTGKLPPSLGYFGVGVMGAKTQANVGTLWRSAYQLGASFLFTIGQRYRAQSTDTVKAPTRIPLFELDDWTAFAKFAPKGAQWVAVEMGGIPLDEFEHPKDCIYILGSEDNGVPNSVVRSCHHVVSLDSERYASYNVAVAASIVMYDRMSKAKKKEGKE